MNGFKTFIKMVSYYKLTPIKLGCEVRGIDLKSENREEGFVSENTFLKRNKDDLNVGNSRHLNITEHNPPYWELIRVYHNAVYQPVGDCCSQLIVSFYGGFSFLSFINKIKEDVTEHRILVFKDQGVITGGRQVEISKWFGDLEVTFYQHKKSPHHDVFRVSNDPEEGCTGVGRTGWHIDGTFQPAPYAYSLYYMASVPKDGATVFAPLTEIIEGLSPEKYAEWDRLWMASDRRSGPVHPLIYTHPRSKKKVLCFHLGMTSDFVYDYGSPAERLATPHEYKRILSDINHEFVKDNGKIQYKHNWQEGDFIISDNCAVGHEASPETQAPRSQVGLRVLHRTTVHNPIPPAK